MAKCDACGEHENMPYKCRRCDGTYCSSHRLPESHDCPGLNQWNDPDGVFDSGFDDSVNQSSRGSGSITDRFGVDTGPGGPLGYFRGNITYVFLAIIWITYVFEMIVWHVLGDVQLFRLLFLLESTNVEYVWTWFTSVFSHSQFSFFHIAGNSIALYFFGPPVERYVGSKKFATLFVVAGVVAGLAQVGIGIFLGNPTGVYGASGAVMAVMAVLTVLNPNLRVMLLFPPIPMPIWVLTGGYVALSLIGGLGPVSGGIAHFAHLSGLFIGLAYGQHVKGKKRTPQHLQLGGGGGGPGGPGRGPGGPGGRF